MKSSIFKSFAIMGAIVLSPAVSVDAGCRETIKAFYNNLPWIASRKLEYVLEVKVLNEVGVPLVTKTFSTRQGALYDITLKGTGGILMSLKAPTENIRQDAAANDLLKAEVFIKPGWAWRRTGETETGFWIYNKLNPSPYEFLGKVKLYNEGRMQFSSDAAKAYHFEIKTKWLPIESPQPAVVEVPTNAYVATAKTALLGYLMSKNHTFISFSPTPATLQPNEDIPFGPSDELWNETNAPLTLFQGDSGYMGARYRQAVAVNTKGEIVWIKEAFLE
ncbi:MAG: hypothetical protein JWQ35_2349 [Bacteriovoracaceae bacterium]|nr:hypothetical protein [Bacteriovoracaceae bacterium]